MVLKPPADDDEGDSFLAGLPHRAPFRFLDNVVTIEPGVAAQGQKTFAAAEPFFAGHFPGQPIVPGVILTEALAQLSGIVAASVEPEARFLLSAIRMMKFFHAVGPEQPVRLFARAAGALGALRRFEVRAETDAGVAAEGELMLGRSPAA